MLKTLLGIVILIVGSLPVASQELTVVPLPRAHAHNDYLHERPLLDALEHGFCSVEADIWLVDGELLVAHDRDKVDPSRTLEGLYLDPLLSRVRKNNGSVHPDGPEVVLLIDIKSSGDATYPVLRSTLEKYREMLTTFETGGEVTTRAVRVIISGSRPRALMEAQSLHYAGYDGRLPDIGQGASSEFMPLISSSWSSAFKWLGRGPMPDAERAKLVDIVTRAHDEGRKVRFWAIPHRETLWKELLEAGVDFINADDLPRLQLYLLENGWTTK